MTPGPHQFALKVRKEAGRVLMELSKMEQRCDAVLAVIRDGPTISEVAIAYGVSRQTIYRWMRRDEEGGLGALTERSHKPRACPLT